MHYIQRPNRHRFIYLVRHGQYYRTPEHPDGTLTELGLRQARHLAERVAEIPLDAIWSSTMYRAQETAEVIAENAFPHLEVQRSSLLREKFFPCEKHWDRIPEAHRAPADRLDRIEARWFKRSNRERHEMLVCHGNLIRALVTKVLEIDVERWTSFGVNNCGLTRIACWDDGTRSVISFNEFSFLPDEYFSVT